MMRETATLENNKIDKLEAMLFQLIELYNRSAQEQQLFNKERKELIKLSELLTNKTKEWEQIKLILNKTLQNSAQALANPTIEKIAELIFKKSHPQIEKVISKLEAHDKFIETMLTKTHHRKHRFSWKVMTLAIISSILISFVSAWLLLPNQPSSLTRNQLNYLRDGQMLAKIWPDLSDQERKYLKNIASKVMHEN